MKKGLWMIAAGMLFLSGCSPFDQKKELMNSLEKTFSSPYYEVTHKGYMQVDYPDSLLANSEEKAFIESIDKVDYHVQTMSSKGIKDSEIKLTLDSSDFYLRMLQDEKESLLGNGKGWYLFDNEKVNQYLDSEAMKTLVLKILKENDIEKEKNVMIEIDGKVTGTTRYSVTLDGEKRFSLSGRFENLSTKKGEMTFYMGKDGLLAAMQYELFFEGSNGYNKDLTIMNIAGSSLYKRVGDDSIAIQKPKIDLRYDNESDFLIDMILK